MDTHAGWFLENVWLIPAIMASSFLVILLVGKRLPEKVQAGIGILAVSTCLVIGLGTATQWIQRTNNPPAVEHSTNVAEVGSAAAEEGSHETAAAEAEGEHEAGAAEATVTEEAEAGHHSVPPVTKTFTWFESGTVKFEAGTMVDGLTAMMLVMVSIIALLVHIYSMEYLHNDVRFTHFYAFLSLFTASMLFYVMSSNTLQMLMGWELVGVCSYALIGHWWEEKKNGDAALKAFLTNRVGDTGLIIGVIVTFFAAGATSFGVEHINGYALSDGANKTLLMVGALCLFAAVTSKSGQFPLHTWLPDAMAGPTPVSALIHAATMVCAGVFLIARLYGVFFVGLGIGDSWINYVALIGGITVVGGAMLAFVQTDIKKVLAYSTVSQLGYMVLALGVGAWTAGIFHLFTHAFFKACLFLGAGSVSHAAHHTFDMREMGGLRKYMQTTYAPFIVATAALMGIFPLAGFWSKDEVLAGAAQGQKQAYWLMLIMGIVGAALTAAYMTRAIYLTFHGEYRGHGTPHESPKVMTIPLVILSIGAVVLGFLNLPAFFQVGDITYTTRFEHYVEPTYLFPEIEHPEFSWILAVASTALVAAGIGLAYQYYWKRKSPFLGLSRRPGLSSGYNLLVNKYYLDHLYEEIIVVGVKGPIARAANWVNQNIIDAAVNGAATISKWFANIVYRDIDQTTIDGFVLGTGIVSDEGGEALRKMQTGKVQQYATILFGAAAIIGGALVFIL